MVARNRAIIFSLWRGGSWGPNNHNNNTIRLEAGELTCSSASAGAGWHGNARTPAQFGSPEKVHVAACTSTLQCARMMLCY